MSTLTSSVIKKSSKKIAPKATVQRRQVPTPASTQPSQRASVERQSQHQPTEQSQEHAIESSVPVPSSLLPTRPLATDEDGNEAGRAPAREAISNEVILEALHAASQKDLGQAPITLLIPSPSDVQVQSGVPENTADIPAAATPTVEVVSAENTDIGEPSSKRRRIEDTAAEVEAPAATLHTHTSDVPTVETSTRTVELDTQPDQIVSSPTRPRQIAEVVIERPRSDSTAEEPTSSTVQPASAEAKTKPKPKPKPKPKGKAIAKKTSKPENVTASSSQTKTKRKRATSTTNKPRKPSKKKEPDTDDETVEIVPSEVKMVDLCKDSGKGQRSQRERELAELDSRKQRERDAQGERGEEGPPAGQETVDQRLERAGREREVAVARSRTTGIKLRLVNGQMVVDDQSLRVDRHANAAAETEAEALEEVEENDLTRRVTSGSWMKREKMEPWDEALTDRFYEGLRMFGTDFMIISKMFPGRTRRQIKLKFTREERQDPDRIKYALTGQRTPMDLEFLSQLSTVEYEDPRKFEEELEKEKREHEEEMKRQEEQAAEVIRQRRAEKTAAIMAGDDGPEVTGENNASAKENHYSQHLGVGNDLGKGKRGGKKQAEKPRKKMFSRHGGGEELEIVGTIEG
ncbi:MAG: Transcription factor TFIIIB component B [Peltula sp. TS41687]|nr:MAG: Transcription factor TFIIIB component B [Peltula sp. TS41687]